MAHSNDLDFFNRIPVAGLLVNKIGRPNFIYNLKFLSLVGYTDAQLSEVFIKDYTKVFDEEDTRALREKLRNYDGSKKSVKQELKLTRSDGSRIITMIEAEVSEENDGNYVLCALTDITEIRKAQADYMFEQERLLAVIKNSDDDFFEYDPDEDLLKIFNKDALMKDSFGEGRWLKFPNFSQTLISDKKFHPEDEPIVRTILINLMDTHRQVRMKKPDSDDYRWYELDTDILSDESGKAVGLVGSLHDIDELKETTLAFKNKSQRDSLTGLYNNASVKEIIENYFQEDGKEKTNALLILDLDDFKNVNDSYGHRFGDRVLIFTAQILQDTFGENDIIARIGGDEFLVFCKDILDMSSVNEKVQTLFKKLESSPVGEDEKYIIRTSVGIAVSPQDGTTCKRLFDKADRNMYKVKRSGKNSYNF